MATFILLVPYAIFSMWRTEALIMLLLDVLLIANLMYFRTYYTAIPLDSYRLSGNLADFTASVIDSLRWYDTLFPLSTIAAVVIHLRTKAKTPCLKRPAPVFPYLGALATIICVFGAVTLMKGNFSGAYEQYRNKAYLCSSGPSIYTVFGSLCYDLVGRQQELTPELKAKIEKWLSEKAKHEVALTDSIADRRTNCIIILAESLESWVLEREVEGQEITPCLNRLLKDSASLYAPYVLTQTKGGRSIDAQLMLCTGLLPINSGAYSSQYPNHTYPSLQKAMREKNHSRNYLLTIDKISTWNQALIARNFGTDTIIAYHDFELAEAFGTHKRTGDGSFFAQCREKIENGEIWKKGENVYMQFVTYSGHAPFVLPEYLREVSFSSNIPQKISDYMTTARYTDKAIGRFVEYLRTLPQYKETLIVITGDHEGLASYRTELCNSPGCEGLVSDKQFTPFVVLNSPVSMRYNEVMGQIDMYPTLLNLLQLDDYYWTGLGGSILDPQKKGFAVGPRMNVEGEGYTSENVDFAKEAYTISDEIIRFDYFGKKQKR
jgi:phosphoglycerol transferase MdoB-like AlkP superfamily enzyme